MSQEEQIRELRDYLKEAVNKMDKLLEGNCDGKKVDDVVSNISFNVKSILALEDEKEKKKTISDFLKQLGVTPILIGYGYLIEAISLAMGIVKQGSKVKMMPIYRGLASRYHSTESKVERAIRHAIEKAFSRGDSSLYDKVFGYSVSLDSGKTTNGEFIVACADFLLLEEI